MSLNKKQVAFLYDLEYDTVEELKRFVKIIDKGYSTIDECQCFTKTKDRLQAQEDYNFMMTMLGVK